MKDEPDVQAEKGAQALATEEGRSLSGSVSE